MEAVASLYCIAKKKPAAHSNFAEVMVLTAVFYSHGRTLVTVDGHIQLVPHYPYKDTFAEAKRQICCRE